MQPEARFCDYNVCYNLCMSYTGSGTSSSGGGYSGGGYNPQLAVAGAIGYAIGAGIASWLFGDSGGQDAARAEAARLREQARLLEEERQRQEAEQERIRQLELKKQAILNEMKGSYNTAELKPKGFGTSGELAYKDGSASLDLKPKEIKAEDPDCATREGFSNYVTQEEERRVMRKKLLKCPAKYTAMKIRADWCYLHIPLPPAPCAPGYHEQKTFYEARMRDWRSTCEIVIEISSPKQASGKTPSSKSFLPEAIAYCAGVYDGAVRGCGLANDCVEISIQSYFNCMDGYESASPMASAAPSAQAPAPELPAKPLLNHINEQEKAELLPQRGESAEEYAERFLQGDAYKKVIRATLGNMSLGAGYSRGKIPVVDKVVDESLRQVGARERAATRAACLNAAKNMDAEYADMEKQGIIHSGEDLRARESKDAAFKKVIVPARQRVLEQFDKDIRETVFERDQAIAKLKDQIPQMQKLARKPGAATNLSKLLAPAKSITRVND
jgi:hypothetical protein